MLPSGVRLSLLSGAPLRGGVHFRTPILRVRNQFYWVYAARGHLLATQSGGVLPPPLGLSQARRMGCPSAVPFVGWGFDGCRWTPYPAPKTPPWGGRGSPYRTRYPWLPGKASPGGRPIRVPSGARGGAGARRNLKRPFTGPCTVPPFMLSVVRGGLTLAHSPSGVCR